MNAEAGQRERLAPRVIWHAVTKSCFEGKRGGEGVRDDRAGARMSSGSWVWNWGGSPNNCESRLMR
jgi:hypothetical protein